MTIPTPLHHADHIGSLLRPAALKAAARAHAAGTLDAVGLRHAQDQAIRAAVAMQTSIGLQSITDGEFRRGSWFLGFLDAVEGLSTREALIKFQSPAGGEASWQTAFVAAKLRRRRGITTDEFKFVDSVIDEHRAAHMNAHMRIAKVTMPAPSLIHFFRGDAAVDRAVYSDLDEFWSDLVAVYREELAVLGKLGCRMVQLDEVPCAVLCDERVRLATQARGIAVDRLIDQYVAAINAIAAARPAGMSIGVHFCRGNYRGQWMAAGGYEPIAERVFGNLRVDRLFLEFDSDRAGGFEPLRFVPPDRSVVLGLVSTKIAALEPVDALARRVEAAARFFPMDRLAISPQCGFASSAGGNPISYDDERRKLERVVEAARLIWR